MGQYHRIYNLDKKEYINPHHLGSGVKAWEQLASGMTGKAMIVLMVCPQRRGGGDLGENDTVGRWHGDRVVMVGDYAEDSDFKVPEGELTPSQIYGNADFKDITPEVCAVIEEELGGRFVGSGWRNFVQLGDIVSRHSVTGNRLSGTITKLVPLTVKWPTGEQVFLDKNNVDFF